jgi:hypothetical protein
MSLGIGPFAVPGLMTVTSPNADSRVFACDDGALVIPVFSAPASSSVGVVTFRLLDENHVVMYHDLQGKYVYTSISGDSRVYTIRLPAATVRPGAHELIVYLDGAPLDSFNVVRKVTGFSEWKMKNYRPEARDFYGEIDDDVAKYHNAATRVQYLAFAPEITPTGGGSFKTLVNIAELSGDTTLKNPLGSPQDGDVLIMRFNQDAVGGHAITWDDAYTFSSDLPVDLVPVTAGIRWEMVFEWNTESAAWRAVGIGRGY